MAILINLRAVSLSKGTIIPNVLSRLFWKLNPVGALHYLEKIFCTLDTGLIPDSFMLMPRFSSVVTSITIALELCYSSLS